MDRPNIGIIGAGAFGTALGVAIAREDCPVWLWARDADQAQQMQEQRCNPWRLPMARFPDELHVTSDMFDLSDTPYVLLAVPTQQLRSVLQTHRKDLEGAELIVCCKGVELGTGLLPTEVVADVMPYAQAGVLTGPSFAEDIALKKPTALTLASADTRVLSTGRKPVEAFLQRDLSGPNLRVYLTEDVIGAQLGGALKNVIAIAAGITIGAGLGESSRAALMTRGFAEINRLAQSRGAHAETLLGLSGFGDLVLTCTSEKSRNFRYGMAIGAGQVPDAAATVEGVMTAHAVAEGADPDLMPVVCMVSALLKGEVGLAEAQELLLSRPLRHERG